MRSRGQEAGRKGRELESIDSNWRDKLPHGHGHGHGQTAIDAWLCCDEMCDEMCFEFIVKVKVKHTQKHLTRKIKAVVLSKMYI